ncbi:hypothetical protein N5K35_28270 [Pseudomonas sp. GD03651]|nr:MULTISPECIES: hypothetical protein [Pseudomonas]MDH2187584.1 hypothetical protein [Pseudomonas sp. GD03651]
MIDRRLKALTDPLQLLLDNRDLCFGQGGAGLLMARFCILEQA